ncbi:MAG: hypothetical protein Q9164_004707 [Protoblastenia rupestris]
MKSMEPSSQGDWPWSPRDCIINHTFELETTRIIWIIIKGNTLIQDRIRSATRYQSPGELSSFRTLEEAFASTLATHLLISEWAAENWDEFITFIETKYHEISRRAMSNDIDIPPVIISEGGDGPLSNTKRTNTEKSAKSGLSSLSRTRTETFDSWSSLIKGDKAWFLKPNVNLVTDSKDRVRPPAKKTMRVEFETPGQQEFTFSDLQSLHHLHDRAKEAILILKLNIKIMSQLVKFYGTTIASQQFPAALRNCVGEYNVFRGRIEAIQDDLHTYVLKLETLVGHVEGCKTLLRGILDFQNKESNKLLAGQSSTSTVNMERMAVEMNHIALKTKTETVSMRVITVVTLCFLPGTFISTLMSTDIFQNLNNHPSAPDPYRNLGPLQLYLALSLPLTFATLLVYAYFHFLEIRREQLEKTKYYASKIF